MDRRHFPRRGHLYRISVNESAPELFPVTIVLNKQLIPASISSLRATFPAGSNSAISLKLQGFLSSVTSH
jgi:hypothetical protein